MLLYILFRLDSCSQYSPTIFSDNKYTFYFGLESKNACIVRNMNIEKYLDTSNNDNCFLAVNKISIKVKNIMKNLINMFFKFFYIDRYEWDILMICYLILEN